MGKFSDQFIIGLTGPIGSGCTTLSNGLADKPYGYKRVSVSDLIKEKFREIHGKEPTLKDYGPDWRAELQDIGNRGRNGEFVDDRNPTEDYRGYWVKRATDNVDGDNLVIDGIRNIGEVEWLRRQCSQFWLVAVYADYTTQWARIKDTPLYLNEEIFKRDNQRDSGEEELFGQNVQRCVYESDYVLKNTKNIQPARVREGTLAEKMMRDIQVMKRDKDSLRNPFPHEVFMATAVSHSHASHCLRRKVGALVVDEVNNITLSVGYNDNPIGMESCFSLYNGQCYKNMVMESKLEKMVPFFCPECGKKYASIKPPWKCDGKKDDGTLCRCNFKLKFFPSRNIELCTAIHAEERAIKSLGFRRAEGCTIYVNTFPCLQCARHIKDAGTTKVCYIEAYPIEEAVDYLKQNNIDIDPFEGFKPRRFNQVFGQLE